MFKNFTPRRPSDRFSCGGENSSPIRGLARVLEPSASILPMLDVESEHHAKIRLGTKGEKAGSNLRLTIIRTYVLHAHAQAFKPRPHPRSWPEGHGPQRLRRGGTRHRRRSVGAARSEEH